MTVNKKIIKRGGLYKGFFFFFLKVAPRWDICPKDESRTFHRLLCTFQGRLIFDEKRFFCAGLCLIIKKQRPQIRH